MLKRNININNKLNISHIMSVPIMPIYRWGLTNLDGKKKIWLSLFL